MFGLGYGELDSVVRVMHQVAPDNAALVARFKYMQRLGFPEGVNPGRGVRSVYGLEESLKVLLAFELLETGATPTRVVRMVRTGWPGLRGALALAWVAMRDERVRPRRMMICATPGAFRELGEDEDPRRPVAEPLRAVPLERLLGWTAGTGAELPTAAEAVVLADPPRRLVIDPMTLVAHFGVLVPAVSAMTRADLDEAFAMLGEDAFDGAPEHDWPEAARNRLPEAER